MPCSGMPAKRNVAVLTMAMAFATFERNDSVWSLEGSCGERVHNRNTQSSSNFDCSVRTCFCGNGNVESQVTPYGYQTRWLISFCFLTT